MTSTLRSFQTFLSLTLFAATIVYSSASHAQWGWLENFEFRAPLGIQLSTPSALNEGLPDKLQIKELLLFGGDALYNFEDGWALGLQYNSVSSIKFLGTETFEVAPRVFSVLARKTWPLMGFEIGPILAIGAYQNSEVAYVRTNSNGWQRFKADKTQSVSLGAELHWIASEVFLLGGELGYHYLTLDSFGPSQGTQLLTPSGSPVKADLSGPYLKLLLGVKF